MYLTWRAGAAVLLEGATALCAALNSAYFLGRSLSTDETAGRRVAAFVLALVSLGTLVESVVLVAVLASARPAIGPWQLTLARAFAIAGVMAMAALVLRRLADR